MRRMQTIETPSAPNRAQVLASFRAKAPAFVDVGHSKLAYRKFGHGPDVVFVHGWPLHSATFRDLVPLLADRYTCHLLDLPGTGQSVWDRATPIDLVAHASTIRRATERLGLGRHVLVAHDSGGLIARTVAADDPRVAGLVLGNTEIPGHTPWLVTLFVLATRLPGGKDLLRNLLRSRTLRRSPLGFGGCFSDLRRIEGEFHELFVAPILESDAASAGQMRLLQTISHDAVARLAEVHARIQVPVRLVWGADDSFFPLALARPMLGQFGGPADLVVVPDAKLFVHEERPAEFARECRTLLDDVLP